MARPEPAFIEIIERTPHPDSAERSGLVPNEIRINGTPLLALDNDPVIVHETSTLPKNLVRVTLTLVARRVVIGAEASEGVVTESTP